MRTLLTIFTSSFRISPRRSSAAKANSTAGVSTLEILIAMAVMVVTLSAVVEVSFGNQDMLVNGHMNAEALKMAQTLIEQEQQFARKDFRLVNPVAATSSGIYQKSVAAEPWPGDPFTTKRVTALVNWDDAHHRVRNVALTTLVTNFENAIGGDTCDSVLSGDWTHPQNAAFSLNTLIATTSGTYAVSDVDTYKGRLYVAAKSTLYKTDPTLFILDISNPIPQMLGMLDNATTSAVGVSSIRVAENRADGRMYAYVASAGSFSKGQLQIMDVTDPVHPHITATYKIPTSTVPAAGHGNSLFYKDGYVYLGLTSISGGGDEFNIIDVHNPSLPNRIGGYPIGSGIEAIFVKGNYAYLATDDSNRELTILNITNPTPTLAGIYNAADAGFGGGFGRSLYSVGDTLYLGRTYKSGAPEFYILNASNPGVIPNPPLGSSDIGPNNANPYGIYGIIARDYLAFVLTKAASGGQLLILNIANPASIIRVATSTLSNASAGTSLDCEGNVLYAGSIDSSNNGYLSIFTPQI